MFDQVCDALRTYRDHVEDTFDLDLDFVVPSSPPWPEATWGLKLGQRMEEIRERDKAFFDNEGREQRLVEIGVLVGDANILSKARFDVIFNALVVYKTLVGDLDIPSTFTVPSQLPWPEETWGLKLGTRVASMRSQLDLFSKVPERK